LRASQDSPATSGHIGPKSKIEQEDNEE